MHFLELSDKAFVCWRRGSDHLPSEEFAAFGHASKRRIETADVEGLLTGLASCQQVLIPITVANAASTREASRCGMVKQSQIVLIVPPLVLLRLPQHGNDADICECRC